jgi:ABC-type nitrate/sulfonate/bicarbonate transport system substrate-binding protein
MLVVPAGSSIESVPDLKGKSVGVVGGEINRRIVDALVREYALTGKVQFKDISRAEAPQALQTRQVQAVLTLHRFTRSPRRLATEELLGS